MIRQTVRIPADGRSLRGDLRVPADADGVVVCATGTSGARHAAFESDLRAALADRGIGTLVADLVDVDEADDRATRGDIRTLADRLDKQLAWLADRPATDGLDIGLCGRDTGGAAALVVCRATHRADALALVNARLDGLDADAPVPDIPLLCCLDDAHEYLRERNLALCERAGDSAATCGVTEPDAVPEPVARWLAARLRDTSGEPATSRAGQGQI